MPVHRELGHSDADRDLSAGKLLSRYPHSDPLRDLQRTLSHRIGQQHGKLFSTVASGAVHGSSGTEQDLSHLPEHFIAGWVTEGIIVLLEFVHVCHEHG